MSLATFVKEVRENRNEIISNIASDLASGILPSNCTAINPITYKDGNLKNPENETTLKIKTGDIVARYHKSIDKWVLNKDISPDTIPSIASKETISDEQFRYMSIIAQYNNYCNPGYTTSNTYRHTSWEHISYDDMNDRTFFEDDMINRLKKEASKAHRQIPSTIKEILSKHETKFSIWEQDKYIRTQGTYAKENIRNHTSKISTEDVMALMYKNIRRIPELENGYISKQQTQSNNGLSTPDFTDDAR